MTEQPTHPQPSIPHKKEESQAALQKSKGPKFKSFEDFVAYTFSRKGQSVKLKSNDADYLAGQEELEGDFFEKKLFDLVLEDALMKVPAQLILTGLPYRNKKQGLWNLIERTYIKCLQLYSASAGLEDWEQARRENLQPWSALETACEFRYVKGLPQPEGEKPLTKSQLDTLQQNLISNVCLWLVVFTTVDFHAVLGSLYRLYWEGASSPEAPRAEQLKLLLKSPDPGVAEFIVSPFVHEAKELRVQLREAEHAVSEAGQSLETAKRQIDSLQEELAQAIAKITKLESQLNDETARHHSEIKHAISDQERLRSRMIRRIEEEVALLQEGLSALRREPPKVHVMSDHAERAIEGLQSDIRLLQEGAAE